MMNNYWYDAYDKKIRNNQRRAKPYIINYANDKHFYPEEQSKTKAYECPTGHTFKTDTPIVIAGDGDPDYNSGPICGYCYVDWFKVNLNAAENNEK